MTEQPMQVRVFENEGGHVDSFDQQFYDSHLPARLDLQHDRCACGAEAHHAFVIGADLLLLTCNHHGLVLYRSDTVIHAHRDYRTPWDEYVIQRKAAMDAALKAIEAKKLDESNFDAGSSLPTYKAQWDRRDGFNLWVRPSER